MRRLHVGRKLLFNGRRGKRVKGKSRGGSQIRPNPHPHTFKYNITITTVLNYSLLSSNHYLCSIIHSCIQYFLTVIDSEIDGMEILHLTLNDLTGACKIEYGLAKAIFKVIKSLQMCYLVEAEIKDAKSRKGIHAHMYKMAQQFLAVYYYQDETQSIFYKDADLKVRLLFKTEEKAGDFRNSLSLWHYDNPLTAKGLDISVDESIVKVYAEVSKLKPVMLQDYVAAETESPIQSLEEFEGHVSSFSSFDGVSTSDPLCKYQSIEKPDVFTYCKPYKMHIKPKAQFKKLASDDNNVLIGSWTPFHQMFDGLHTEDDIPLVAVRPVSESSFEPSMLGEPSLKRFKVDLELKFRNEGCASKLGSCLKDGSIKVSETVWKSNVYVLNPELFCDCLKWKMEETEKKWQELDED